MSIAASVACPSGWRLPTEKELKALSTNYSAQTSYKGVNGRWFSGTKTYSTDVNRVFLPTQDETGNSSSKRQRGYYWSSTRTDGYGYDTYYKTLNFNSSLVSIEGRNNVLYASVRCVKDE